MLSKTEFSVLNAVRKHPHASQRALAEGAQVSLGTVNTQLKSLVARGLVTDDGAISDAGMKALAPYRVDNAIIMAAGLSSRFAPISYERPKGVLRVRGEVLIERQIRQLHEAGIDDITVVVGYKKEEFFYLEDSLGVSIEVNGDYAARNNNSTLFLVRDRLANTYICSSDDYFTENVFEPYVYEAYYAAEYADGPTDEYCLEAGAHDVITGVTVGGQNAWYMLGQVYFDRAFSRRFVKILEDEYDRPETAPKLWEDIYREHLDTLHLHLRKYAPGVINEFDSLDELREFDPDFVRNVDSEIFDNICRVLGCDREAIHGIVPIKKGLTNLSFMFVVGDTSYVYRHPGANTGGIIDRASETFSQQVAAKLGIDDTFICEDPKTGWKVSRFIEGCTPFEYHNTDEVAAALVLVRKLHTCGEHSTWAFDVFEKAQELIDILKPTGRLAFPGFEPLLRDVAAVRDNARADAVPTCLCHNDFYAPNILVAADRVRLIDWEYSGESDYASDLGTFICCSDYTEAEADRVFEAYFGRAPEPAEYAHCQAYVCLSSFYWFVWALYQDESGKPVGAYQYRWYRFARVYADRALKAYAALGRAVPQAEQRA